MDMDGDLEDCEVQQPLLLLGARGLQRQKSQCAKMRERYSVVLGADGVSFHVQLVRSVARVGGSMTRLFTPIPVLAASYADSSNRGRSDDDESLRITLVAVRDSSRAQQGRKCHSSPVRRFLFVQLDTDKRIVFQSDDDPVIKA